MIYLDTSALAKRYLVEPDSEAVREVIELHQPALFTSPLTFAELLSVLRRTYRERRIGSRAYSDKREQFLRDWRALQAVELNEEVLALAANLVDRYELRGADTVHLCSALWLGSPEFACFDERLSEAAAAEGLQVVP